MREKLLTILTGLFCATFLYAQEATVTLTKTAFKTDEKIGVTFTAPSTYTYGYVAIYKDGQDITSLTTKAAAWSWTKQNKTGSFTFSNPGEGRYFAIFRNGLTNLSSKDLSERAYFYVTADGTAPAAKALVTLDKATITKTDGVKFTYTMNEQVDNAWVAIYKSGADIYSMFTNAGTENQNWKWISGTKGTKADVTLSNPGTGRWFVVVRSGISGKYSAAVSEYSYFEVVDKLANPTLTTASKSYAFGENVKVNYSDMPGGTADRLVVYSNYGVLPLKKSKTAPGVSGTLDLGNDLQQGDYHVVYECSNGKTAGDTLNFTVERPAEVLAAGDIKIGIVSDVHIMDSTLVVNDGAAFQAYLKDDRKLLKESSAIAAAAEKALMKNRPDLLIVSGDLTKDGERKSHELFVKTFHPLIEAGTKIIVVPGNHDVNNPHAVVYDGGQTEYTATVTPEEFATLYRDFGYGQALSRDAASLSYVTEPVKGLRVFALDGCKYYDNTYKRDGANSDSCVTEGKLKPETIAWLKQQADAARKAGKQMIAVIHHNVIEHFNGESVVASPYLLDNYSEVQATLMEAGIPVCFTGHFHSTDIKNIEENNQKLYEVETGSLVTYPCPYRMLTLNKDLTSLNIETNFIDSVNWNTGGMPFQKYAKTSLANGIPGVIRSLVDTYYSTITSVIPQQYKAFVSIPAKDQLGDLLVSDLAVPAARLYLTHNEGNENLKDGTELKASVENGIDAVAHSLAAIAGTGDVVAQTVKGLDYYKLLEDALTSILGNMIATPTVQTDKAATASNVPLDTPQNDLYATIALPAVSQPTGLNASDARMRLFFVSPNITPDGNVKMVFPATVAYKMVRIYSLDGRLTEQLDLAPDATEISYHFTTPGIYIVHFGNESQRVIVK